MGMDAPGAFAPRVVWPARHLHRLPDAVGFEAGALAEPLGIVLRAVGKLGAAPLDSAVVVGAGTIGLLTVAVLRRRGIERIAVTDLSAARLEIARRLGAEAVVDPAERDARAAVLAMTDGAGAAAAFDYGRPPPATHWGIQPSNRRSIPAEMAGRAIAEAPSPAAVSRAVTTASPRSSSLF